MHVLNKSALILLLFLVPCMLLAQSIDELHGDQNYSYWGLHSGNQIHTTFHNDGQLGAGRSNPELIGGVWPANSGHNYLAKMSIFVGAEVRDTNGQIKHIVSEANGTATGNPTGSASSGDASPEGEWWSFAPLPGFANDEFQRIAMSHWDWSWPETWPDKMDDAVDPGWPDAWNGYFGKALSADDMNADQESYYVMDDYNNIEFSFYPDSMNQDRRGLGIRVTVRGFQWSNVLVQDILFLLYDIKNAGTHSHDKMTFGSLLGPNMGSDPSGSDSDDDSGAFSLDEEIGYIFDNDDIGQTGWTPVGYLGLAFFESPGNPFDGIDNDGDGDLNGGSGAVLTEATFAPKEIAAGESIVLIDYNTFERNVTTMPADGVTIDYLGHEIHYAAGAVYEEIANDLIDNNLNGIIDENNGSTFGGITRYLFTGHRYVDYFTGEGADNLLIDERRDDGIDNDGDWNPLTDDHGLDGARGTGDPGEGDGVPTSGAGTDLPGEVHFDKTDIDESDMIGLTAFKLISPWTDYPLSGDEELWNAIIPGTLDDVLQNAATDLCLGSGYFPLKPEQIERFSLGYMYAFVLDELFRTKGFAEKTYNANYNFAKAPRIPTVKAVAGDGQVTLFWDDAAEHSIDPITGEDFEGYRIYRSTDKNWSDMQQITDGYGTPRWQVPMAQFDVVDSLEGFHPVQINGMQYWLGSETGISHSYVDTTAVNGFTYYYAVTSYDRGDAVLEVPVSECSKYLSITADGDIDKGDNVVIARPEAPAAGFIAADSSGAGWLTGSRTDGAVELMVQDPSEVKDGHVYQITFEDTTTLTANRPYVYTKNFSLHDITDANAPVTLIDRSSNFMGEEDNPDFDGFRIALNNVEALAVDEENTAKSRNNLLDFRMRPYKKGSSLVGIAQSADYRIEFGEKGYGSAMEIPKIDAIDSTNVKIYNTSTGEEVAYAMEEKDGDDGMFSGFSEGRANRSDILIFLEKDANDSLIVTWEFVFLAGDSTQTGVMEAGDFIDIAMIKPFTSKDIYKFTMKGESVDVELGKAQMDDIKVVPNPYVVANSWEPQNPYSTGRGPRELHFTHLPAQCTIRIFNVRGQLVQTLEHDEAASNGTEIWDMMTKDNLDIAYGVYVFHVDGGKMGQKIGKFAVIK